MPNSGSKLPRRGQNTALVGRLSVHPHAEFVSSLVAITLHPSPFHYNYLLYSDILGEELVLTLHQLFTTLHLPFTR